MAAASDCKKTSSEAGITYTLAEFCERCHLPQTVSVMKGQYYTYLNGKPEFTAGDTLVLHSTSVQSVTLSFRNASGSVASTVDVPLDFPGEFTVKLSETSNFSERLRDNLVNSHDKHESHPLYYIAKSQYQDFDELSVSVNKGDRFLQVDICDKKNGAKVLRCKGENGTIIHLPIEMGEHLEPYSDSTVYTIRQLVSMAPVSRLLRISEGCKSLESLNNFTFPEGFSGKIFLHTPKMFVDASPWNNTDIKWSVPVMEKILVKKCTLDEFEKPLRSNSSALLSDFLLDHAEEFPVVAEIQRYPNMPFEFDSCLSAAKDVIFHRVERIEKIAARCSDGYCLINSTFHADCRLLPRTFSNISELYKCKAGTELKVLDTIASDFPKPFSLTLGDVIKIPSFETCICKIRHKWNRTVTECKVLKCEKLKSNGGYEKIRLPIDLDVRLLEMIYQDEQIILSFSDIFKYRPELPLDVEICALHEPSSIPLFNILSLDCFVYDVTTLMTPRYVASHSPAQMTSSDGDAMESNVSTCLEVPQRHNVKLVLKKLLNFPHGYFRLPPPDGWTRAAVENISWPVFNYLKSNEQSYETFSISPYQQPLEMSDSVRPYGDRRGAMLRPLSRIGKSISSMSLWKGSRMRLTQTKDTRLSKSSHNITSCSAPKVNVDDSPYEDIQNAQDSSGNKNDIICSGIPKGNAFENPIYEDVAVQPRKRRNPIIKKRGRLKLQIFKNLSLNL